MCKKNMIPGPAMLVSLYQLVRKVPRKDYYKCLALNGALSRTEYLGSLNVHSSKEEFLKSLFQIIFISF